MMRSSPRSRRPAIAAALGAASVALLGTHATADRMVIESFEAGSNIGEWSWGTGNETIAPLNGNPGAYLEDLTLFTCCPTVGTAPGQASPFTGNYRERGVSSAAIDLITLDASTGVGGRPLTIMLVNDNDTPFDFDDDGGAYFVGDENIPAPGVPASLGNTPAGWHSYEFEIPAQATTTPPGWTIFSFGSAAIDWNTIITDVDMLQFYYGVPGQIYLFASWDVGIDNPRVNLKQPAAAGDLNDDGAVNAADLALLLGAWSIPSGNPGCGGAPSCAADLNGDTFVNAADLALLLGAWG